MIKAIIFDCYGVLVGIDYVQQFAHEFVSGPEVRQQFDDLHRQVDLGLISRDSFIQALARLTNLSETQIRKNFDNKRPVNEQLLEFIRHTLKPKYKIGMLSNVSSEGVKSNFTPEELELFDDIVLSSSVGMAKPEVGIFQLAAQRLGVEPQEAIMIDDLPGNCHGAEAAGFRAIYYRTNQQCIAKLQKLLTS